MSDRIENETFESDRNEEGKNRRRNRRTKPQRETLNIQFANTLPTEDLLTLLQYELLRARDKGEDVRLPQSIVHNIKFRLSKYFEANGEIAPPEIERDEDR